eukprot:354717-Chlamydomonas_euryale.AAC.2
MIVHPCVGASAYKLKSEGLGQHADRQIQYHPAAAAVDEGCTARSSHHPKEWLGCRYMTASAHNGSVCSHSPHRAVNFNMTHVYAWSPHGRLLPALSTPARQRCMRGVHVRVTLHPCPAAVDARSGHAQHRHTLLASHRRQDRRAKGEGASHACSGSVKEGGNKHS